MIRGRDLVKILGGKYNEPEHFREVKLRTFAFTHYSFHIIFHESLRQFNEMMTLNFVTTSHSQRSYLPAHTANTHENLPMYKKVMQRKAYIT